MRGFGSRRKHRKFESSHITRGEQKASFIRLRSEAEIKQDFCEGVRPLAVSKGATFAFWVPQKVEDVSPKSRFFALQKSRGRQSEDTQQNKRGFAPCVMLVSAVLYNRRTIENLSYNRFFKLLRQNSIFSERSRKEPTRVGRNRKEILWHTQKTT